MTLKELDNLPYLSTEIDIYTTKLEDLKEKVNCAAPPLSGMPRGSGNKSKVEQIAVEIADIEKKIAACKAERKRLEDYISSIQDSFTRSVFYARFGLGLSWPVVADYVNSRSPECVKKICYRYLKMRT